VVLGAMLFRLIIAGALRAGLDPNALKLVSAVFVFLALVVPGAVRRRFRRDRVSEGARG
jgi:putative tryptophan/tyrosine transport system permease protein